MAANTARVLGDISLERRRQVAKGYNPSHDDAGGTAHLIEETRWHLNRSGFENVDKRTELIKAAALIVAAIETLDRVSARNAQVVDFGAAPESARSYGSIDDDGM